MIAAALLTSDGESDDSPVDDFRPAYRKEAFRCPSCEVVAGMNWSDISGPDANRSVVGVRFATCQSRACGQPSIWVGTYVRASRDHPLPALNPPITMVWPPARLGAPPVQDMPGEVAATYEEARAVLPHSPRAAAALMRLALQQLMPHLGQPGEHLNTEIGNLVKDGLPPILAKAADAMRLTGNDAVHPGEIDVDDAETVASMFMLANLIVERLITQPKQVEEIFGALPEGKRDGIEQRDGSAVQEE